MRCDLRGISIHYESVGEGRPFLMLHGSPGSHAVAKYEIEPAFRARKNWMRVYPDLPGHGKTPGTERIHDFDDYLEVLIEFVDELFPRQKITMGGTSFGAYLALGFASKRGGSLDGLLLSVPMLTLNARREPDARNSAGPMVRDPEVLIAARREGLAWILQNAAVQGPGALDYARAWKGYTEDRVWLEALPTRDFSFDPYHRSRPFLAPALFLFGRQDAPHRYLQYWKMVPSFPRATFAILDRAGHLLWGEQRKLSCAIAGEWLDRVEAGFLIDRTRTKPPRSTERRRRSGRSSPRS